MAMAFTIDELEIPATIQAPDATDFLRMTALRNEIEAEIIGSRILAVEGAELLPTWLDPFQPKRLLVARVDDRMVARGVYETGADASAPEAWVAIEVLPEFRRQGIGAALYNDVERMARAEGRTVLQGYGIVNADPRGRRLHSPTGFGSVPEDAPVVRFARARGFSLEQVERASQLLLPPDRGTIAALFAEASASAGNDYRIARWVGRTPDEWIDDIALLGTRMSTDAPNAGLEVTEDIWDAARIRAKEEREESSPITNLVAAAEHVPSGRLVAYTELSVPRELERAVSQEDTLVLREHRGHRLGMLVKLANIRQLDDTHPGHPAITTFNAEENRHMLSVNEAVGFVAMAYEAAWRKEL
ncbi:GNAT family N-acetyltransferase [Glaciihabitans sp. dw_435]|uniref:GNAT family N-acetyltransferase n=1 Tax=Glaciihabitans sp. dw_435 TaxID=2720081 RepID=UPI001BD6099A|nr:GNAT family N-acetyltransferase [Glaciihabitans sp. dw_435]